MVGIAHWLLWRTGRMSDIAVASMAKEPKADCLPDCLPAYLYRYVCVRLCVFGRHLVYCHLLANIAAAGLGLACGAACCMHNWRSLCCCTMAPFVFIVIVKGWILSHLFIASFHFTYFVRPQMLAKSKACCEFL